MTRLGIKKVLEQMNALERLMAKYNDRSDAAYQEGKIEKSYYLNHRADLAEHEIKGIMFTLRTLGLSAWKTRDGEWVVPDDDITRAI